MYNDSLSKLNRGVSEPRPANIHNTCENPGVV